MITEFVPKFLFRAEKDRAGREVSLISVRENRTFRMLHFSPIGAQKQKACIYAGKDKYTSFFSETSDINHTTTYRLGKDNSLLVIVLRKDNSVDQDSCKFPSFVKEQEKNYFFQLLKDGNIYDFLIYYLLYIEWIREAWTYKKEN